MELPLNPINFGLELHHLSLIMGIWVFDCHDFTIPMVGLVEITRSGRDIVNHGGAIHPMETLMDLIKFC